MTHLVIEISFNWYEFEFEFESVIYFIQHDIKHIIRIIVLVGMNEFSLEFCRKYKRWSSSD